VTEAIKIFFVHETPVKTILKFVNFSLPELGDKVGFLHTPGIQKIHFVSF